ncbi:uncharacterized protein LY89DRAFT_225543 [Mollisia scopiformis]|uniref:Secreted protein n=1 Tax=Mollisia scopiformis TaxID=149040 RepID=A0A194WV05_MOLSC|nr:uncharacterized protein LY89DRAFT_225543 [Mollisia scopiformis]KUJ11427.1 hypothetical protein LY89DRAFT_225543 [Mollisia scopiformis]
MYASGLFALLACLSLSTAQAPATQDLSGVSLAQLAYGGSGCPQGSLKFAELITPWRFVSITDGFTAAVGSNASVTDQRKACQINISLNYPAGLQFTLVNSTYSGYANLGYGVNGTHNLSMYFSGSSEQKAFPDTLQGTLDEKFTVYKLTHLETTDVWSPCGAPSPLNVVNELSVTQTGTGSLYDSGIMDLAFLWRTC